MKKNEILRVEGLRKVYRSGTTDLVLFDNLSFRVREGEMLAIVGQSGAGKSSLLHILGALDTASAGEVLLLRHSFDVALRGSCRRVPQPAEWAMYGSSTTCCRSLRRWRTWRCRCICGAKAGARRRRKPPVAGRSWTGRPRTSSFGRAFRRRAAKGFAGAGAGDRSQNVAGRRADRGFGYSARRSRCLS